MADIEARLAALETRVAAAEGVLEIQSLKARYASLVDQRYSRGAVVDDAKLAQVSDQIAALFTTDGTWDGGKAMGLSTGRAEIAERMRKPTLQFSWHYFLKPDIHVEGGTAKARWDILSPCTTPDGRPHWMSGFEDDEYAKVDGVWLHSSMRLSTVFLAPHETGWNRIFV